MIKTCICAIAKNENHYIREWVEHYYKLKFSNIILYDNNDINGERFDDVINDYIKNGFVKTINVRGKKYYDSINKNLQVDIYNEAYKLYSNLYDWIMFIDIDEFLILYDKVNDISDFLNQEKFKQFNTIKISWKYFDDNDLIDTVNDYSCKERFTRANELIPYENLLGKCIIKTNIQNVLFNCAHLFENPKFSGIEYNVDNVKICDALGNPASLNSVRVHDDRNIMVHECAVLNHYRYKTIKEYIEIKVKRGWADKLAATQSKILTLDLFFKSNKKTDEKEKYITKLLTNMSIKHYVIIRFYCMDMYNIGLEKLFNNEKLLHAAKIFERYTLRSLENQTNKNFEIILMIHNDISYEHIAISYLCNIKSNIKINIVKYKDLMMFINNSLTNEKYLITTRIDDDDLIYNYAVEEIQSKCNDDINCYYNGYDRLITMINDDYVNTYKFYPKYNGNGSISIFQSLIINRDKINKTITVNHLGGHTNQKENFKKIFNENNLTYKEEYFNVNHLEDSCIYIKHNFNISTIVNPGFNENWHRTNIKVDKPKEWFIERFGNFIDE